MHEPPPLRKTVSMLVIPKIDKLYKMRMDFTVRSLDSPTRRDLDKTAQCLYLSRLAGFALVHFSAGKGCQKRVDFVTDKQNNRNGIKP